MLYPEDKCKEPTITYELIEDVSEEVIPLEQAKDYMGIDFDDFDLMITKLIKAVRKNFERWTGLSIGMRKIKVIGDYTSELAYMPFEPITEKDGDLQTVGYTSSNCDEDLVDAMLNVIHTAFENRADIKFNISDLCQLASKGFRRRVGI